ncbi:hypothetical protein CRYUN_Cryun27aG0085600 [Craigia yunnanensis]
MDSSKPELVTEFPGVIRVYKDGRVERLIDTGFVPPSTDPQTGVSSKDIMIIPESNVSARLFLPKLTNPNQKLPLLVYFHGGAFCVSSPFTPKYSSYLSALVAEANVIAVSVNYRKAPEHPIPTAYEDSWASLQWVVSHYNSQGPEVWLNDHADFERVFLGGESGGANIVHNLAIVAGDPDFGLNVQLLGIALVHPHFWGSDPIGSEALDPGRKAVLDRLWPFLCPSNPDNNDPRVNPVSINGPSLVGLGCKRVLVCVAENDVLRDRGWLYYEALGRSGWMGVVEIMETEGEDHGFHLYDLECEKAKDLITRLAAFYNRDMPPFF